MCMCSGKIFFFQVKVFFSTKAFSKRAARFISRYQFATAIIVINHKMDKP